MQPSRANDPSTRLGWVSVPMGFGELIDRITILEIKASRIEDAGKRANVARELALLLEIEERALPWSEDIAALRERLREANEELWEIEDRLRDHERRGDFGGSFVDAARQVYRFNDARAATKREINERTGSALVEEKSYLRYDATETSKTP